MGRGPVTFILDSGERLTIAYEDARRVYDTLWALSIARGAVTVAVQLMRAWRNPFGGNPIKLTHAQSELLRRALAPVSS